MPGLQEGKNQGDSTIEPMLKTVEKEAFSSKDCLFYEMPEEAIALAMAAKEGEEKAYFQAMADAIAQKFSNLKTANDKRAFILYNEEVYFVNVDDKIARHILPKTPKDSEDYKILKARCMPSCKITLSDAHTFDSDKANEQAVLEKKSISFMKNNGAWFVLYCDETTKPAKVKQRKVVNLKINALLDAEFAKGKSSIKNTGHLKQIIAFLKPLQLKYSCSDMSIKSANKIHQEVKAEVPKVNHPKAVVSEVKFTDEMKFEPPSSPVSKGNPIAKSTVLSKTPVPPKEGKVETFDALEMTPVFPSPPAQVTPVTSVALQFGDPNESPEEMKISVASSLSKSNLKPNASKDCTVIITLRKQLDLLRAKVLGCDKPDPVLAWQYKSLNNFIRLYNRLNINKASELARSDLEALCIHASNTILSTKIEYLDAGTRPEGIDTLIPKLNKRSCGKRIGLFFTGLFIGAALFASLGLVGLGIPVVASALATVGVTAANLGITLSSAAMLAYGSLGTAASLVVAAGMFRMTKPTYKELANCMAVIHKETKDPKFPGKII